MKDNIKIIATILIAGYFLVANITFAFRHPWTTETERFLYLGRALLFQTVEYEELRPRN